MPFLFFFYLHIAHKSCFFPNRCTCREFSNSLEFQVPLILDQQDGINKKQDKEVIDTYIRKYKLKELNCKVFTEKPILTKICAKSNTSTAPPSAGEMQTPPRPIPRPRHVVLLYSRKKERERDKVMPEKKMCRAGSCIPGIGKRNKRSEKQIEEEIINGHSLSGQFPKIYYGLMSWKNTMAVA